MYVCPDSSKKCSCLLLKGQLRCLDGCWGPMAANPRVSEGGYSAKSKKKERAEATRGDFSEAEATRQYPQTSTATASTTTQKTQPGPQGPQFFSPVLFVIFRTPMKLCVFDSGGSETSSHFLMHSDLLLCLSQPSQQPNRNSYFFLHPCSTLEWRPAVIAGT